MGSVIAMIVFWAYEALQVFLQLPRVVRRQILSRQVRIALFKKAPRENTIPGTLFDLKASKNP
jgi:hypothetical protein